MLSADGALSGSLDVDNSNRLSGLLDKIDSGLLSFGVDDHSFVLSDELSGGFSDFLDVSTLEILEDGSIENDFLDLFGLFGSDHTLFTGGDGWNVGKRSGLNCRSDLDVNNFDVGAIDNSSVGSLDLGGFILGYNFDFLDGLSLGFNYFEVGSHIDIVFVVDFSDNLRVLGDKNGHFFRLVGHSHGLSVLVDDSLSVHFLFNDFSSGYFLNFAGGFVNNKHVLFLT